MRAQRSEAGPLRGRGRAAGAARRPLRRHYLFFFVAGDHLELTSVLQRCQRNRVARFLVAQVFIDLRVLLGPVYTNFLISRNLTFHFSLGLRPCHLLFDF